jgi:hypothetical protein
MEVAALESDGDDLMMDEGEDELMKIPESWPDSIEQKEGSKGLPKNLYDMLDKAGNGEVEKDEDTLMRDPEKPKLEKQRWVLFWWNQDLVDNKRMGVLFWNGLKKGRGGTILRVNKVRQTLLTLSLPCQTLNLLILLVLLVLVLVEIG